MDNMPRRLESLYREVGPDLLGYFRNRHRSPETAEDLLQDTFAAAAANIDRVFSVSSPRAYLFGIARNLSMEVFRRARPEEPLPREMEEATEPPLDPAVEAMREAIAGLSPQHREVLELRLQRELSYEEIAQVLQTPIGTVRSRLHYAIIRLREAICPNQ